LYFCFGWISIFWKKTNKQRENPKSGFSSSAMRGLLVLSFILIAFRPLLENRVTRREKQIDPKPTDSIRIRQYFFEKKKILPSNCFFMDVCTARLAPSPAFFSIPLFIY